MPDLKISQLPVATTPLAGTELVPIVQGGVTDQTTVQAIMTSTVPSGTANGVLYLNGSKVATSGSALTFDGTGLANALNNNTPKYISVSYSTVPAYFSNSFDGSVGLSTLSNNTWNNSNGSASWASFANTGYSASAIQFATSTGASDIRFLTASAANTNPTEQMRLTSTGLGIGTSSPTNRLTVAAPNAKQNIVSTTGTNEVVLFLQNTGGDFYIGRENSAGTYFSAPAYSANLYSGGAYPMLFWTNSTERMRLDSSGNLGLGVTPSATQASYRSMELFGSIWMGGNGTAPATYSMTNNYYDGSFKYKTTGYAATYYAQQSGQHQWYTAPSGTAGNAISFTQAMTLDADGRLGIGITNPAYRLDVEISSGPYSARFNNSNSSTNQYNVVLFGQAAAGSAIGYIGTGGSAVGNAAFANNFVVGTQTSNALVFNTADTERARITSAGDLITNVNGTAPSLSTNSTMSFELTSNTSLKIVVRGTDGVTRSVSLTLA